MARNLPLAAIEEAMVNAVYHRSCEIREPMEVRMTPEELMVLSFPGPDRSIRMEDLRAGRAVCRRYRNRRIGEFLKELDLTEGRSTGIPKILRVMRVNGSPAPVFESDDERSSFLIRLPVHDGFAGEATQQVAEQVTEQVGTKLGPSRGQVLVLTNCIEASSIAELMTLVGRSNRTKFREAILTPLLEAGLVEMTQPDSPRSPTQRYRLTVKGKAWLPERRK